MNLPYTRITTSPTASWACLILWICGGMAWGTRGTATSRRSKGASPTTFNPLASISNPCQKRLWIIARVVMRGPWISRSRTSYSTTIRGIPIMWTPVPIRTGEGAIVFWRMRRIELIICRASENCRSSTCSRSRRHSCHRPAHPPTMTSGSPRTTSTCRTRLNKGHIRRIAMST